VWQLFCILQPVLNCWFAALPCGLLISFWLNCFCGRVGLFFCGVPGAEALASPAWSLASFFFLLLGFFCLSKSG